ncbi:MAG: B12-binding domain-containing radical SAM protein [Candidatus Pacebacteria bacterium]|nr:B12-binding domain-containing radical SAM protein [Candidatus Paceibacterota bacterium]NUQ57063.1 radical SAM protein [Candidatus Paceibacter sp.]
MKIVLINPPSFNTITSCLPKTLDEGRGFTPPLGIMYIAAQIEKETNHQVEILDAQVDELTYEQLKTEIQKRKPDAVGITAMTFTLIDVIKTAKIVKEIDSSIKIIIGGPHVIIYPEETAGIKEVDFVIIGEAEPVIKPLLDNINDPDKLEKVKGLVFRKNDKIINTGRSELIKNIDDLPFPARHLTNYKKYYWALSPYRPITTMFTSRGCPYQCLFCDRPNLGKNFRPASAKRVVDEMEECQKMGIQEIFVYDDTFGVDRRRVLDICDGLIKRNIKIAWNIRTRVNTVDAEVLSALKKAGCQRIHYGVEAGTQKILNVLRKGITLEMVEKAFKLTRKAGIQTAGYFMIGSPTETEEDILKTIKFMNKLKADYMHITIVTPYPATGLYAMALKEKVIDKDYWLEFAKNPTEGFVPKIWEKEIPREKLFYLMKKAYRSFYLRPSFVFNKIIRLKSGEEFLRKAKAAVKLLKI